MLHYDKAKHQHLDILQDRSERLQEYEREKELNKIRKVIINERLIDDSSKAVKKGVKSLVEVTERITDISPTLQKALNLDELKQNVVKKFNFSATDILNYMKGNKQTLFDKIKILDPVKFKLATDKSNLSDFTMTDMGAIVPKHSWFPSSMNTLIFNDGSKGLEFNDEYVIDKNIHNHVYLTDGYFQLKEDYDYMEDMKYKGGIPIYDPRFRQWQYILYHGISQNQKEFRQIFINNVIKDFEKSFGELSRHQKTQIINQVEEEIFENFEHIKSLEDVLDNLNNEFSMIKRYKKEINLDWVEKEIQESRKLFLLNSPENIKDQKEFVHNELVDHKKFIDIQNDQNEKEFEIPDSDEKEFRLGMDLICQLDEKKSQIWGLMKSYVVDLPEDSDTFKNTFLFRQIYQKTINLYSNKKMQLLGSKQPIIENLYSDEGFASIDNFLIRNTYSEIIQFFSPHVFFNLSCWGIQKMNNLMNEIKFEIESMRPEVYRRDRDTVIDQILIKYGARDKGLTVSDNLELLDILAFGFADLYQEFRNKLFFAEDILRKQSLEIDILERSEAKENLRKKRLFNEQNPDLRVNKSKFETMMEDIGINFESKKNNEDEIRASDKELEILKNFLEENGITRKYLDKVEEFGKVNEEIEMNSDHKFKHQMQEFANNYLEQGISSKMSSDLKLKELEKKIDFLISDGKSISEEDKRNLIAIAQEIRLGNNYTLTENLEKMGGASIPSFDLFRKEKARAKRDRQRLTEKLHIIMGNKEGEEYSIEKDNLTEFTSIVNVDLDQQGTSFLNLPSDLLQNQPVKSDNENLKNLNYIGSLNLSENSNLPNIKLIEGLVNEPEPHTLEVSVLDFPIPDFQKLFHLKNITSELEVLPTKKLKNLFKEYLNNRNIKYDDKIDYSTIRESQLTESFTDLLLKYGANEQHTIQFLNKGSIRNKEKENLIGFYSNIYHSNNSHDMKDETPMQILEDLKEIKMMCGKKSLKTNVQHMDIIINNFINLCKDHLNKKELSNFLKVETNPDKYKNNIPKKVEFLKEDCLENFIENLIRKADILKKIENKKENFMDKKIPPKFKLWKMWIGINDLQINEIKKILEVLRIARAASNSRIKQYILMLKGSDDYQEREIVMQQLRKEFILFKDGYYNKYQYLSSSEQLNEFELFINALSNSFENEIDNLEDKELKKKLQSILTNKLEPNEKLSDSLVKLFKKTKPLKLNKYHKKFYFTPDKNFLSSKENISSMINDSNSSFKHGSLNDFLTRIDIAMKGRFNSMTITKKSLTLAEKIELIKMRKEILYLLSEANLESKNNLKSIENQLIQSQKADLLPELHNLINQGMSLKRALKKHSVLGGLFKNITESQNKTFISNSSMYFMENALRQVLSLKDIDHKNFFNKIKNNEVTLNLDNKYLPEFNLGKLKENKKIEDFSKKLTTIQNNINKKLNLNKNGKELLSLKLEEVESILKSNPMQWSNINNLSPIKKFYDERNQIKKVKDILWKLFQTMFSKNHIEALQKANPDLDIKEACITDLLCFYEENDITKISLDFDNDILGLRTDDQDLKKELITIYNVFISQTEYKCVQYINQHHETVFYDKNYNELRNTFKLIFSTYADKIKNRLNNKLELNEISITQLQQNEDVNLFQSIEAYLYDDIENIMLDDNKITPEKQSKTLKKWITSTMNFMVSDYDDKNNLKTNKILLHNLFNLSNLENKKSHFLKRLKKEKNLVNKGVKDSLDDFLNKLDTKFQNQFLLKNEININIINMMSETLKHEIDLIISKIDQLDKYKRGILTPEEMEEFQGSVDKVVYSEILKIYNKPIDMISPSTKESEVIHKNVNSVKEKKLSSEEEEVSNILDGRKTTMTRNENSSLLSLLLRSDINIKPKIIVENKNLYLYKMEEWKNNMKEKGMTHYIPDIDFREMVQQRKQTRVQIIKNLFNQIEFDQSDQLLNVETSGISLENDSVIKMEEIISRNLLKESIVEKLNDLISGHELNLAVILVNVINQLSSDSQQIQIVDNISKQLIMNSFKKLKIKTPHSKNLEELTKWANNQVSELVKLYSDSISQYLNNAEDFKNLIEKEKIYLLMISFELYFFEKVEFEYVVNILKNLKAQINFDNNEYERIKNMLVNSEKIKTDHVTEILNLVSSQKIKSQTGKNQDKIYQFEYCLKEEDLLDEISMDNHFNNLSQNFVNLSKVPTSSDLLKNNKSLVNMFDEHTFDLLQNTGFNKFLDLNLKKSILIEKLKSLEYNEKLLKSDTPNRNISDGIEPIQFHNKEKIQRFIRDKSNDISEAIDIEFDQESIFKDDLKYQENLKKINESKKSKDEAEYVETNVYSHNIIKQIKAEFKFDTLAEKIILQEIYLPNSSLNLIEESIAFGRESNKLVENNLDNLKHIMPKEVRDTRYDQHPDVYDPHFNPGWLNKEKCYTERRNLNIEEMYSGLMLKKKLNVFLLEGLKKKREGQKYIRNLDDTHLDMIKFVLDNFRGSGVQKYKIEEWLRKMPAPDQETKESIQEMVEASFENIESLYDYIGNDQGMKSFKSMISDLPDLGGNPEKIRKLLETLAKKLPSTFRKDDLIRKLEKDNYLTPEYVIDYLSEKAEEHKQNLAYGLQNHSGYLEMNQSQKNEWLDNPRKFDLYDQFYDDKAAKEFLRLKKMKKLAKESMKFKYDDIHRSLDKKGRDFIVEEERQDLFKDTSSYKAYEIKHPDDGKVTFKTTFEDKEVITFGDHILQANGIKEVDEPESYNTLVNETEIENLKKLNFGDPQKNDQQIVFERDLKNVQDWFINNYMIANFSDLDEVEQLEFEIVTYLFYLNQQKKISIGDIFMEISRRRMKLDPLKFKGISSEEFQQNQVRLNSDGKREDIKKYEAHLLYEFADMFPDDKLTPMNLMQDDHFIELISKYLTIKYNNGIPFSDAFIESFNLIELYFGIYQNKKEPLHNHSELLTFKEKLINKDPLVYLVEEDKFYLVPEEIDVHEFTPSLKKQYGKVEKNEFDIFLNIEPDQASVEEPVHSIYQIKTFDQGMEPISNIVEREEFHSSIKILKDIDYSYGKEVTDQELEETAKKVTDIIIQNCPDIYLNTYGEDPGHQDPKMSIKNQILRRFDDQVSVKPVLDIWKKPVEMQFSPDKKEYIYDEDLLDSSKRPDYLKKDDYDDAKESLERQRIKDIFNEMQDDPFFESKLKEYFSDCHNLEVKNVYEKNFKFLNKTEEILDRRNSPLVKNELVDFLMKYSDLKSKMEKDYYSAYAGSSAKIDIALQKQKEKLFIEKSTIDGELELEENISIYQKLQKIKDFDEKFLKQIKKENNFEDYIYKKSLTSGIGYDINKLEFIMNKIKDRGQFGGFHADYYKLDEKNTEIPFAFEEFDFRKNGRSWMTEKVHLFMHKIMNIRFNLEKYMSKEEMERFDYDLKGVLTRENISNAVLNELDQEISAADILRKNYLKFNKLDVDSQFEIEITKWDNMQKHIEKSVKDKTSLHRVMALDSIAALKREKGLKHKKWKNHEKEMNAMLHSVEEAVGQDFNYLSYLHLKKNEIHSEDNSFSEKDGYKSGRYINNETTALYYDKTIFREANEKNTYSNSGTTQYGMKGILPNLKLDKHIGKLDDIFEKTINYPEKSNFRSIAKGLSNLDHTHNVSKSLGWYFDTINEKINPKY